MNSKINLFGVVIVFNPNRDVISNIETYVRSLDTLYIYDNSEKNNHSLFEGLSEKYKKVIYLHNGINDGISLALNTICKKLYSYNNAWLLTMDQDSRFEDHLVEKLFDIDSYDISKVGIISPMHKTVLNQSDNNNNILERLTVMTSGNVLNIKVHKRIGGFDERYFIDCVDWEYCLKLNRNGFKVLQKSDFSLSHGLGEPILVKNPITGKKKYVLNHSPLRRYYITRNKLLISKQYFSFYPKRCVRYMLEVFFVDPINILMFESEKKQKIKYYFLGLYDFVISNFGKYKD